MIRKRQQLKNLFLKQSYLDAWGDYERSLNNDNFIRWNYIVLTASNEEQANAYRYEITERLTHGYLAEQTKYLVVSDPDGKRVGSGGATLNVLKQIRQREAAFDGLRILVIHSGGIVNVYRNILRVENYFHLCLVNCRMGAHQRYLTNLSLE